MQDTIDPSQRIQEAHGLWELSVARVAALVEVIEAVTIAPSKLLWLLLEASKAERAAFENWQRVSKECGA